jgi:hypothetical protein
MNDIPRQKLAELVGRFGFPLCEDHQRCEGLLKDVCGKYKAEINVLVCAARDNVGKELLQTSSGLSKEILIKRLTNRLHENLGIDIKLAQWGVETWALALGIDFSIAPHTNKSPPSTSQPSTSPPSTSPPSTSQPSTSQPSTSQPSTSPPSTSPPSTSLPNSASLITNTNPILDKTTTILIIAVSAIAVFFAIGAAIKTQPKLEKPTKDTPVSEKIISANEARNWLGEVVTVRVLIKSTHDGFDWGFLINSEEDFRNENNFTTVVDKATAGAIYNNKGVVNLNQYFKKNMVILVKGEVKTYDRKSNVRYQIKVTDPNQITIEK